MLSDKAGGTPDTWAARYDDRDDEELAARVAARRQGARPSVKPAATDSPPAGDEAARPDTRPAGQRAG